MTCSLSSSIHSSLSLFPLHLPSPSCPQHLSILSHSLNLVSLSSVNFHPNGKPSVPNMYPPRSYSLRTDTRARAHTHALTLFHYRQRAVSLLKSHKEHNKAAPSANLLTMGNSGGHAGKHELGATHSLARTVLAHSQRCDACRQFHVGSGRNNGLVINAHRVIDVLWRQVIVLGKHEEDG